MSLANLILRLLSVAYFMVHSAVPLRLKLIPILVGIYVLNPRDLWFDARPFGLIDDAVVAVILLSMFSARASKHVMQAASQKQEAIAVDYELIEDAGESAEADPSRQQRD